jgi:methylated-DNA-protein-cysteine methyltransferase-like protein
MPFKKPVKKPVIRKTPLSETYRRIYAIVKKIPRGKVASYGQVARLCGMERHARLVGYALHALKDDNVHKVPWQRVINAKGYVSLRDPPYAASLQQRILESEGVMFDAQGRVDMKKFGWRK